jgi:GrpB-like predicted nucleotidyltransferase (UPF0157 family)
MIVIINSIAIPLNAHIAKHLAQRYGVNTHLDLHSIGNAEVAVSFEAMLRLISLEEIGAQAEAGRQKNQLHTVLYGTFATPRDLRQVRCFLSAYDDEIYAFRLPILPSIRAQVVAPDALAHLTAVYAQWEEAQEVGIKTGDMGYEIPVISPDPNITVDRLWNDIHAPIELVEYQPEWPEMFAQERSQLLQVLPDSIVAIEHIGSTAIPAMPAKPIIDTLITVKNLEDSAACLQPLRELGYAFIDYPQNIDRRFFRKGTPRSHHIHIVQNDHPSAHAHIRFRDALLNNSDLRGEYRKLKYDSMQQFKYRRALYGKQKGALIRKALELWQELE